MDDGREVEASWDARKPKPEINPWCQSNPKTQLNQFLMRYTNSPSQKGDMQFETVADPDGDGFVSTVRLAKLANTNGFEGVDVPEFRGEKAENEKMAEQNAAQSVLDLFADWIEANPHVPKDKSDKKERKRNKRKASELGEGNDGRDEYELSFVDGPEREDAASQKALNNQPAWMTRGVGINKEIFGESQGNLVKPGMYEEDLLKLEAMKGIPSDEPDPFGDVFAERGSLNQRSDELDPLAEVFSERKAQRVGAPDALADVFEERSRTPVAPRLSSATDPLSEFPAERKRPLLPKPVVAPSTSRAPDPLAEFARERNSSPNVDPLAEFAAEGSASRSVDPLAEFAAERKNSHFAQSEWDKEWRDNEWSASRGADPLADFAAERSSFQPRDPLAEFAAERNNFQSADPLAEFAAERNHYKSKDPLAEFAAERNTSRSSDPLAEFAAERNNSRYSDPLAEFAAERNNSRAADPLAEFAAESRRAPLPSGSYRRGGPVPKPSQSARYQNKSAIASSKGSIGGGFSARTQPAVLPVATPKSVAADISHSSSRRPAVLPAAKPKPAATDASHSASRRPAPTPKPAAKPKAESVDVWSLIV